MNWRQVLGIAIAHDDLVDQLRQLCGFRLCRCVTGMRQDDSELIAAQPPDNVGFPRVLEQNIRHTQQHIIPGSMSEDIIDRLEMIKIDENQRKRRAEATSDSDLAPNLPLKRTPVEHRAERVIVCEEFGITKGVAQMRSRFSQENHFLAERLEGRAIMRAKRIEVNAQNIEQSAALIGRDLMEFFRHWLSVYTK